MKGWTKLMVLGAFLISTATINVEANSGKGKTPAEKSEKYVQKLGKQVELSARQEKKILKIKAKELQKVEKLQAQIDKLKFQSKTKVDKTLTKKQRLQLEASKNKKKTPSKKGKKHNSNHSRSKNHSSK